MIFPLVLIILAFICLLIILSLVLPKQRIVTKQSVYDASPQTVYNIVTDNNDWTYRSDLSNLQIIEKQGDIEAWKETDRKGNVILFRTKEKVPCSFYSFDMKSRIFTGYWTAYFEELPEGKTLFTATEHIRINNPIIKVLSYLFFDIGKYMEKYQSDLDLKIKKEGQ